MAHSSAKWPVLLLVAGLWSGGGYAEAGVSPYKVRFLHVPERALKRDMIDRSEAVELRDRPPPNDEMLLVRGERDRAGLIQLLHSRGYYAARLQVRLAGSEGKRRLIFDVEPGPLYRIGTVRVHAGGLRLPTPTQLGLRPGQPARADLALEAERAVLQAVRERGHPFPSLADRDYRIDATQALLHVELTVEPGRAAQFGPTTITGLTRLAESYVLAELDWKPGDPFDPRLLEDTHTALSRSGLFSALAMELPDRVPDDGQLPLNIRLRERRRRTVSATVGYKTDEGAGAGLQWEHRNLFGEAEGLRVKTLWAEQAQSGEILFSIPHVTHSAQELDLSLRVADEQPDAYDSRNVRLAAALSRDWNRQWSSRIGPSIRLTRIDQLDEQDDFLLISLPARVKWDTTDNILDARRGFVLQGDEEPFYDALAGDVFFLKSTGRGQLYKSLTRDRSWVMAGRLVVGGLAGASRSTLPADELFYAGGGSSIRGYAYQSVGPLVEGEPVGGRSLFESSLELRWQISRKMGLVSFLDGGSAFASPAPDFDETLRWGTGAGVRFYTPVGPLRVDVGIPLDRRPELDKSYQLYVSLGQAF